MKNNLTKRIQKKLSTPQFKVSLEEKDLFLKNKISNSFENKIDYHDKTIFLFGIINKNTVPVQIQAIKYATNIDSTDLVFLDSFIEFAQEKDIRGVKSITIREIDNFLRDDNVTPSFENDGAKLFPLFEVLNNELSKILEDENIENTNLEKKSPTILENYKETSSMFPFKGHQNFLELNQSERMLMINEVIIKHIAPSLKRDGGGIYPVFADDSLIVVQYTGACTSCNLSLTSTMDYVQRVMQLETRLDNLMVMTDS